MLFALARALGEAWPEDAPRDVLVARAFGAKRADESHRARLRVEVGRLRAALRTLVRVSATKRGFQLVPRRAREVVVLARPVEERARGGARLPCRRRVVVELGARACARREPAYGAAGARAACGGRQGAVLRPRPRAALDDAARAGIHDDLVTPRSLCRASRMEPMKRSAAEIIREYGPFPGVDRVGGVTFDGQQRLVCVPETS